ncbi:DUF2235 domain-containing protein [Limisalsivibrio acetivorans]|uniref:DUF2235 domain-containing protein n=1 Tax=Limisalsivibrio acetivorans TaxID=1304888 RepID=UPI0003B53F49|nr:DUF2235 domain-containing protein [Limisalsivibrio acetivorans]
MKSLVICYDGTWNDPEMNKDGVSSTTNVYKISNLVADRDSDGNEQKVYYHPGVGTEGFIDSLLGGMMGKGIEDKICSGYHWLAMNYEEGDRIYIFGFSRGAFTARSLGGLLGIGLPHIKDKTSHEQWKKVHRVFEAYRTESGLESFDSFIKPDVELIGVWDTVGALGIPDDLEVINLFDDKKDWEFYDNNLGSNVKHGRHAMAIDEIRSSFTVTRWTNREGGTAKPENVHKGIVEKWFPGAHSDVGGGNVTCDLSDGALIWMVEEAENIGLKFRDNWKKTLKPDPCGVLHDSYRGMLSKLRSRPRNIPAMIEGSEHFHESAFERQRVSPPGYPKYYPTKILEKGEEVEFDVFASERWNYTGIFIEKGSYIFSADGEWVNDGEKSDWRGAEDDDGSIFGGMIKKAAGSAFGMVEDAYERLADNKSSDLPLTKRVEGFPWFCMVGSVANDMGECADSSRKRRGTKNDGSPYPHQYVHLASHGESNPLEINHEGYLYCFSNDAWRSYDDNKGSIRLRVKRVE